MCEKIVNTPNNETKWVCCHCGKKIKPGAGIIWSGYYNGRIHKTCMKDHEKKLSEIWKKKN